MVVDCAGVEYYSPGGVGLVLEEPENTQHIYILHNNYNIKQMREEVFLVAAPLNTSKAQ